MHATQLTCGSGPDDAVVVRLVELLELSGVRIRRTADACMNGRMHAKIGDDVVSCRWGRHQHTRNIKQHASVVTLEQWISLAVDQLHGHAHLLTMHRWASAMAITCPTRTSSEKTNTNVLPGAASTDFL